tara:strand:- start:286 stop:411 length:126 start_codon:yes stop_codon:yes gene_type:complete
MRPQEPDVAREAPSQHVPERVSEHLEAHDLASEGVDAVDVV